MAHSVHDAAQALEATYSEELANEQLRLAVEHASVGTAVATAFALLLAWQLPTNVGAGLVIGWVVLKLTIAVPRIAQALIYRIKGFPGGKRWRIWIYRLLAIDGVVWGLAGVGVAGDTPNVVSIIIPCMACVAIVATYGLQARFDATAAYVVPIILLTAVGLLARADSMGLLWGIGLLALLGLLLSTARRGEARIAENFLLRFQAVRNEKIKDEALALAKHHATEREIALELAQRKSAVKSQFLAAMSHELRTPLHGMLGVARLLQIESHDSAVQRRVDPILSSGAHLLNLINDLLDISRIESGELKITLADFDLAVEADRMAEIYTIRAEEKGLAFSVLSQLPRPCWVRGDPSRLRQILHNLCGNAIKFTKTGFVSLSIEQLSPNEVVFDVRDSGVGISQEDQLRIFDAFSQVGTAASRPFEGAGLGLTIAREVARAMHGEISCKSAMDVGSSFRLSLPLPPADHAPAPVSPKVMAEPEPMLRSACHVLLAEDNDLNAIIAEAYLARLGVGVERVSNGGDAVHQALREVGRPDMVLMDLHMPTMDGFAATREIRAREKQLGLPRIPIVALTATAGDEDRNLCFAAGMDDFLSKPFEVEDLARVVNLWLDRTNGLRLRVEAERSARVTH